MLNYFEQKSSLKELKSSDLFFYKKVFVESKKIREIIREKMEKKKGRKEGNTEVFIVV